MSQGEAGQSGAAWRGWVEGPPRLPRLQGLRRLSPSTAGRQASEVCAYRKVWYRKVFYSMYWSAWQLPTVRLLVLVLLSSVSRRAVCPQPRGRTRTRTQTRRIAPSKLSPHRLIGSNSGDRRTIGAWDRRSSSSPARPELPRLAMPSPTPTPMWSGDSRLQTPDSRLRRRPRGLWALLCVALNWATFERRRTRRAALLLPKALT